MKRDPRLRGLSSDHHHALALARRVAHGCAGGQVTSELVRSVWDAYERQLAPHFAIEEEVLLPALARAGEGARVERTLREHEAMRAQLTAAAAGDATALAAFATTLAEHVRFEEHELFPALERTASDEVLQKAQARCDQAHPR